MRLPYFPILIFSLLATEGVYAAPSKPSKEADAAKVQVVKMSIAKSLKDPDSAKFRGVKLKWGTVCGEVNAKNSYGGYAGYRRFYAIDGTDVHMEETRFSEAQWAQFCGPQAKKPEPPAPYHEEWLK